MNKKHDVEKGENDIKENFNKALKPVPDEGCNAYYTRKQRTTETELSPDADAEMIESDDSFAESRNYPNQDQGPMNTPWVKDRYGRK